MKNDFPKLGGFSFLFWGRIVESGEGCESKKIKISVRRVRDTRARKTHSRKWRLHRFQRTAKGFAQKLSTDLHFC